MTFRTFDAGIFLLLLAAAVALDAVARERAGIPTVRWMGRRVMSTRGGRLALWFGWAWLGWHFFVR